MAMTEEQSSGNPFSPGTGFLPDHLAGRESEQDLLREALKAITGPREWYYGPLRGRAPQPLKIVGPRGVGKTALLAWARREARPLKADVVRLAFLPDAKAKDVLAGFMRELAAIPGFNFKRVEAQVYKYFQMVMNLKFRQPSMEDFGEVLAARLRFRPLLLLLDEVMHYDPKMMSQVLQQSQNLASDGWPLAIVLAGTPALEAHLDDVDATFIDRAKDIYINRLKPAATREALSKPFADRGVKVSDKALKLMLSWTDGYPFFIQAVGSEVWKAKEKQGRTEVDVALVQSVEQAVHSERVGLYKKIYRRIRKAELLEQARKVVAVIEDEPNPLKPEQVIAFLAEDANLNYKDALKIYNQLLDAGLFWELNDDRVWPAIPSFFTYFKEEYKQGSKSVGAKFKP